MSFIIYWQKFSYIAGSFGIEYITLEVLNKIRNKSITHNIFRIQDNEFIMCGFYFIAFLKFMTAGKTL